MRHAAMKHFPDFDTFRRAGRRRRPGARLSPAARATRSRRSRPFTRSTPGRLRVPVRERHRRREGRPLQLPGRRAVSARSRPRGHATSTRHPACGAAPRPAVRPRDDPLDELRRRVEAIRAATLPELPPFAQRRGRLRRLRRRPLRREPAQRPARTTASCPTWRSPSTTRWSSSTTSTRRTSWWRWPGSTSSARDLQAAYADAQRPGRPARRRSSTRARCTLPPADIDTGGEPTIAYQSNFTQAEFEAAVEQVRRVHPRRRHLPGRHQPAAGSRRSAASRSRSTARCGW